MRNVPFTSKIELPIQAKDVASALEMVLSLIRQHSNISHLHLKAAVTSTSSREPLEIIARRLPPTARGFRSLFAQRPSSAEEFFASSVPAPFMFDGIITDYLSADESLDTIAGLISMRPSALRPAIVVLEARRLVWNGAPASSSGSLFLFDMKAFNRVTRFSLSAAIDFKADPAAVPEILRQVTLATGLPFDKGHVASTPDTEAERVDESRAQVYGTVCLNEVVHDLSATVGSCLPPLAPSLLSGFSAMSEEATPSGNPPPRVNFPALLKRQMRALAPEIRFLEADGERLIFAKALATDCDLALIFSKTPRILGGKGFDLSVGVRSSSQTVFLPLSFFTGKDERLSWAYSDAEQASAAIAEAAAIIGHIVPLLSARLPKFFAPWPMEIPSSVRSLGGITALEGFPFVQEIALAAYPDALLCGIFSGSQSYTARSLLGPSLTSDGRLTLNGVWSFLLYSRASRLAFRVDVPFSGTPRLLHTGHDYQRSLKPSDLRPLPNGWLDSHQAIQVAENNRGREHRAATKVFDIHCNLKWGDAAQPAWTIEYLATDRDGRLDFRIAVDALTGVSNRL
jgi:hypothetical protein